MQRYDSYKDSGIFWQPQIPNNWIVKKLGYVLKKHNRPRPLGAELLVCTNKATVIKKGDSKMGMTSENEEIYQGVAVGDLLIHGMDTWHGAIAISKYDGMCTPVVHVCTSEENVAYISYYLRNMATQKVFKLISNGVRQNTSDFRGWDKVKEILCPIPPLPEQQAIASYLDTATAKIDEAIAQQQKMIDLLNERKQIIINNAVTKGLNPNAKMKPSGIDWIGNIPEHWEMVRLGYCAWIRARLGWKGLKADEYVENGYPFLSAFNIQNNKLDWNSLNYINKQRYEESPEIKLKIGDILLVKDGAGIGKCARVDSLPMGESTANGSLAFITSNEGVDYKFLYYFIISDSFKKNTFNLVNGMGVPHLTQGEMKKTLIPIPLKKEQMEISSYLDGEVEKIENVIMCHEKQISFLLERKQIIINDIVTGKVKVL